MKQVDLTPKIQKLQIGQLKFQSTTRLYLIITGNLVTIFVISNIQVIDEADRMMDEISKDWISQVEKSAYPGKSAPFGVASLVQARPKPGPVTLAR